MGGIEEKKNMKRKEIESKERNIVLNVMKLGESYWDLWHDETNPCHH